MRVLALVLRRLVWFAPTLLGLLAVTFVISRVMPADPVALVAGETATPAQVDALRRQLGFDRPLPVQFVDYVDRLAAGRSRNEPVHDAPHRRRSCEPAGRHHRADAGRDGVSVLVGIPARRRLRPVAQLVPRSRAPRDHGLGPRHRELLARHHAPAPLRHAPGVDAAQRAARGLSAARRDRALPARCGARVGLGGLHERRSRTSRCPRPRLPSPRSPRSCGSRGRGCSR